MIPPTPSPTDTAQRVLLLGLPDLEVTQLQSALTVTVLAQDDEPVGGATLTLRHEFIALTTAELARDRVVASLGTSEAFVALIVDESRFTAEQITSLAFELWDLDPRLEVIAMSDAPGGNTEVYAMAIASAQFLLVTRPTSMADLAPLVRSICLRWRNRREIWDELAELEALGDARGGDLELMGTKLRELVSERRKADLELRHAQRLEAVGQLAAGIAHEINTPVQFIGDSLTFLGEAFEDLEPTLTGFASLQALVPARDRQKVPSQWRELERQLDGLDLADLCDGIPDALERAKLGIARVANIVLSMRDFGRPQDSAKSLADINASLKSALTVARSEYKQYADLHTQFSTLPCVRCCVSDLNQVWLNLIVNAAQAISAKVGNSGERGRLTVTTQSDGSYVHVEISDTGAGIPEHARHRIFDPFFTTKPVGQGTGQGLAISHAIVVERHAGSITVDSRPGDGTRFVVTLPVNGDEEEVAA